MLCRLGGVTCPHIVTPLPTIGTWYSRLRRFHKFASSSIPLDFWSSSSPLCGDRRFGCSIVWNSINNNGNNVGCVQVVKRIIPVVFRYIQLFKSLDWITFPPLPKVCYKMLAWVFQILPNPTTAPLFVRYHNVSLALSAMRWYLRHVVVDMIGMMTVRALHYLVMLLRIIMFTDFKFTTSLLKLKYFHTCCIVPLNLYYLCNLRNNFPCRVCHMFLPIQWNPRCDYVYYLLSGFKPRHAACVKEHVVYWLTRIWCDDTISRRKRSVIL